MNINPGSVNTSAKAPSRSSSFGSGLGALLWSSGSGLGAH